MKDLKAFMTKVSEDNKLAEKVAAAKSAEEVVSIAAEAGYKFTADDLMEDQLNQVAGGKGFIGKFTGWLNETSDKMNAGAAAVSGVVNAAAGAVTGVVDASANVVGAVAGGVNGLASAGKQTVDVMKNL